MDKSGSGKVRDGHGTDRKGQSIRSDESAIQKQVRGQIHTGVSKVPACTFDIWHHTRDHTLVHRSVLSDLQTGIKDTSNEHVLYCLNQIEVLLHYEVAVVSVDVEETSAGDKNLETARQLLREHFTHDLHVVLLHLKVLNSVGFVRCSFADYENALIALKEAEMLYKQWTSVRTEDPLFRTFRSEDAFVIGPCNDLQHKVLDAKHDTTCEAEIEVEKAFTQTGMTGALEDLH